ncbi:MAG: alpha/beta hydrolase fold domain-containing protein [Bryobacterales bacterium]
MNTIILRNRLRSDGYEPFVDGVSDAMQAIRAVRTYAKEWNIDPNRIGIIGFSAGAELSSSADVEYVGFDREHQDAGDPFAKVSARPDFVGIIYPGPTPFAPNRTAPEIPADVLRLFWPRRAPGDRVHAIWANEFFTALLSRGAPNLEMHVYGHSAHPGGQLPDGTRMSGGLTDRKGLPFGTWRFRFIDWMRDLGFLGQPGVETKAAKDVAEFVQNPLPAAGAAQFRPPGALDSGVAHDP